MNFYAGWVCRNDGRPICADVRNGSRLCKKNADAEAFFAGKEPPDRVA